MTTIAQHRAEMNALTITVAVETQLFRWAAEVDRLKALNAELVEALEETFYTILCQWPDENDPLDTSPRNPAWVREAKAKARAALHTVKGEATSHQPDAPKERAWSKHRDWEHMA